MRTRLAQLQRQLTATIPGHAVDPRGLHMTLVFLGEQDDAVATALVAALARAEWPTGQFTLDTLGHFARPQVVWAGPRAIPHALGATAEKARALSAEHTAHTETRAPFVPHVTLVRAARTAPPEESFAPIEWPLLPPRLVRSERRAGRIAYTPW